MDPLQETMEKDGNYMSHIGTSADHHQPPPLSYGSDSFDKLSFADVMQFADFGPKLGLQNQVQTPEDEAGIDPVFFLKFPVLSDDHKLQLDNHDYNQHTDQPLIPLPETNNKGKRKRMRSMKTSEEVESQRMTHIAVERNRRKQMNEHLRVLRSLMPSSYVHRGDQASIIGGAIEFVRELEQLLQCLESQKRRRICGDGSSSAAQPPLMFPTPNNIPNDEQVVNEYEAGLREESAESKTCFADVEVKVLGFDALIKILSRRRDGQLIKAIAGLEEMQLSILHTNITTIEQTVLYSFNVKIGGEARLTAEDMANSVQQIFSFIHASSSSSI